LKGILGIVGVVKNSPAYTQHHPPVRMDEGLKGSLFSSDEKGLQELAVRHGLAIFQEYGFTNLPYRPA
jgi:hypothetical protein